VIWKIIRSVLSVVILAVNWVTTPKRPQHSDEVQKQLDEQTQDMALYQFNACPFCVKTRRAIRRLGLNIELRDAKNNPQFKTELIEQGGEYKVPCLAISENGETRWMYESDDIISYLNQRFTQTTTSASS